MKWYNIVIIGLIIVGIVLVQRKFFPDKVLVVKTVVSIVKKDSIVYRPKLVPYAVEVPVIDTFKIPADTAELIRKYKELNKEYYTKNYFKDSLIVDSIGYVNTSFKVTQNKVFDYKQKYSLQSKKVTTQIISIPKNQWYVGGSTNFKGLAPTVLFDNKGKMSYFGSYDIVRKETTVGVLVNLNRIKLW